jgi:seryl-tRNA synthetase
MHDIRAIRDNPQAFNEGLRRRGLGPRAESLIALDEKRRTAILALQTAQERRNAISKQIGVAMGRKDIVAADDYRAEVAGLKASMANYEEGVRRLEKELNEKLAEIPNLPLDDTPNGKDENDNVELRQYGRLPTFPEGFKPKEHFEIGEALALMDFDAAAKMSGARFVVLKGALARLERALEQFMLDLHTSEHGYVEVSPPVLVRDAAMFGTAQLPKFKEDQFPTRILREKLAPGPVVDPLEEFLIKSVELPSYKAKYHPDLIVRTKNEGGYEVETHIEIKNTMRLMRNAIAHANTVPTEITFRNYLQNVLSEERNFETLWLIPTAEVPLTNLVRETIVDEKALPLRFTAGTLSFRAEAGAAGRDTRGMIRQHQFKKVELVSITTPEQSRDEHERMTACAEEVLKRLGLHFRTVALCAGDMGFAAQKTYDIEVWLPGQGRFREISSCSVCGDFQARRMNARTKGAEAKSTRFVHTLNGSGVAVGRALIAVLETYHQPDGSVAVPDVLRPYMGGVTRIEAAR